jgi:hypothetical protein
MISDAVDKLAAGGNTNLPAGVAWAWRVLTTDSPFEHTITMNTRRTGRSC